MPYSSLWSDLASTPFKQGYIDAGGIRTRILESGSPDKPLLLLLHGTGGHAESYVRNLGPLGEHFWTVAFDFVGHGWSDKPPTTYEIKDLAAHVLAVMAALGRERAFVTGDSVGGWVTTHLAVHHPKKLDRIVLNVAGGWGMYAGAMGAMKDKFMAAVNNPTTEYFRKQWEGMIFDKSLVTDDLVESRRRIYAQPDFAAVMPRLLALRDTDVRARNLISEEQYGSIKTPTLVMWTTHHGVYTVEEGKHIAGLIPGAEFVVMNDCGQVPQYESPDAFNKILIAFFKGQPLPALPQ